MPNPSRPWLRLWDCTLDLGKAQRLPAEQFKAWINLLMLANRQNESGRLPEMEDIAFALRIQTAKAQSLVTSLVKANLIDKSGHILRMHDWETWQPAEKTSAERSKEWREEQKQRALSERSPSAQPERSRVEESREEQKREDESRGEALALAPPNGLGADFKKAADLVTGMTADLSWCDWVHQQACAGHSAQDIEDSIREASAAGKLSKPYAGKILQRWAKEGKPQNGTTRRNAKYEPYNPSPERIAEMNAMLPKELLESDV